MTYLKIGGETFRVEVEGDEARPTLLLASSLGSDLSLWDLQMPAFLAHFRIVRYDPRGHGQSTCAGAPYSLARLGADALAILDALHIERTHVLGISMGGAVAQWLLVHAPERIDRAVLANTNARFTPPQVWNDRIRTAFSKGTQALAAATMERWFSDRSRAAAPDRVAATEQVFRATSAEGYAASAAALRDMDMREALRAVDRPVLLVTGREDGVATADDIADLLAAIPGARHVELDARHISNIEAQAAFDAAVIAFLTGPASAAARKPRAAKKTALKPATRWVAARATSARSRLERTRAVAAKDRRSRAAGPSRATTKAKPAKAKPRKAEDAGSSRRAPTVVVQAPAATAKSPARKAKAAAVTDDAPAKPRRAKASSAPRKAVAKKAVTKAAVTGKAVAKTTTKKAAGKKAAPGKATSKVAKPAPRRTTTKRPGGRRR